MWSFHQLGEFKEVRGVRRSHRSRNNVFVGRGRPNSHQAGRGRSLIRKSRTALGKWR